MKCPVCQGPMTPMMVSWFCPKDCDRKQPGSILMTASESLNQHSDGGAVTGRLSVSTTSKSQVPQPAATSFLVDVRTSYNKAGVLLHKYGVDRVSLGAGCPCPVGCGDLVTMVDFIRKEGACGPGPGFRDHRWSWVDATPAPPTLLQSFYNIQTHLGPGLVVTDYRFIPASFTHAKWWGTGETELEVKSWSWLTYAQCRTVGSALHGTYAPGGYWNPRTGGVDDSVKHVVQGAVYVL